MTVNGSFTGTIDDIFVDTQTDYITDMTNIQSNDDHDVMITWAYYDVDKTDVHFMYALDEGSGFSMAQQIPYLINIRTSTDPNPSYINMAPNLVATPNGNFHQVYYAKEADLNYNVIIWDLVYDGVSWLAPRIAYDDPTSYSMLYDISVCAESDGDIHISGEHARDGNIHYVKYNGATDTWLPNKKVATDCSGFPYGAIDVDQYHMVHIFYVADDATLRMKVFCEESGEAEILAEPEEIVCNLTSLYMKAPTDLYWDSNGVLMALYQDDWDNPVTYFNRYIYN